MNNTAVVHYEKNLEKIKRIREEIKSTNESCFFFFCCENLK